MGLIRIAQGVLSSSFVKINGTAGQFLKADGTVDSTTYEPTFTKNTDFNKTLVAGTDISIARNVSDVTITNTAPHIATNLTSTSTGTSLSVNSSTGTNVTIPNASASVAGIITNTTQTFAGNKTFDNNIEMGSSGWLITAAGSRTGIGGLPNLSANPLQVHGGFDMNDGNMTFMQSGVATNAFYTAGNQIMIMRNFGSEPSTLFEVRSKVGNPLSDLREATIALTRTDDAGNTEFLDIYNNGYHTGSPASVQYGIRIQKRGTGEYRPFKFDWFDGTTYTPGYTADITTGWTYELDVEAPSFIEGGVTLATKYEPIITTKNTDFNKTLVAGTNISIARNGSDVTISSTDTNTTYTAGTGITLSGTTFSITSSGVTATQLAVTGNGTTSQYLRSDGDGSFSWVTPPDTNTTYSAGSGISLVGTTFSNSAPDQTVVLTQGGATTISGTYPNFTISSTNTTYTAGTGLTLSSTTFSITSGGVGATQLNVVGNGTTAQYLRSDGDGTFTWATPTNTTYSAGTGLSLTGTTFANTAPDQTVVLTQGGATTISGTYPNFTISSTDTNTTYTGGTGITLSGTTFSITSGGVGATQLNVAGNGTTAQYLRSDGDGSFSWVTPPDTNTTYSAGTGLTLTGTTFTPTFGTTSGTVSQGNHTHDNRYYTETELNSTTGKLDKQTDIQTLWSGTQAEYDAIGTPSSTTIYFIE